MSTTIDLDQRFTQHMQTSIIEQKEIDWRTMTVELIQGKILVSSLSAEQIGFVSTDILVACIFRDAISQIMEKLP